MTLQADSPDAATLYARLAPERRLSERVADAISESIGQQLSLGSQLPSERVLAEQFGVSRTVIREAVRILGAQGVIEVRPGRRASIAAIPEHGSGRPHAVPAGIDALERAHMADIRMLLEPHCAAVAARHRTDHDVASLEAACQSPRAGSVSRIPRCMTFHRAVAQATHNPLYLIALDAIAGAASQRQPTASPTPDAGGQSRAAHLQIVQRIAARDVAGARRAMGEHLTEIYRVRQVNGGRGGAPDIVRDEWTPW